MKTNRFNLLLNAIAVFSILFVSACGVATATPTAVSPATAAPATAAPATAAPATAAPAQSPVPAVLTMPAQIAGARPVAITVSGAPPDSQPTLAANYQAAINRFEALYPNVTIRPSDYLYNPATFAALVAGNQVPTLFQAYFTDPAKMVADGVAADLTAIFKAQGLDKVYNPQVMSLVTVNGKIYGIPMKAYAMGLAYNKTLLKAAGFDNPPTTWAELETMAKALTNRDNGVAGFSFIFGDPVQAGWHTSILSFDFGVKNTDLVNLVDGKYVANFDNPAMLATLNLIHNLRWVDDVLPRENNAWDTNGQTLATGHEAMALMASDQFIWIKQTFADVDMSQFGFAPLPGVNGTSVSQVGGDVAMVSATATADQIEAAAYYRLWLQLDPGEIMTTYTLSASDPTVVVGGPSMPLYTGDYQAAKAALDTKYSNLPVDYALFQEGIVSGATQVMLEPGFGVGQDFYGILGPAVSTIVTDQNANVAALLTAANKTFQTNVLDLKK
jgi:ABC-type glycerol-3-phosphate transport system substrate-binding protein